MVTIYGSPNCLHCLKAKQLAEIFQIEHEYKSLTNLETKKEFFKIAKNVNAIPQIVWGDDVIVGYNDFENRVNEFIEQTQRS